MPHYLVGALDLSKFEPGDTQKSLALVSKRTEFLLT